jgi:hypothetical protein
MSLYLLSYLLRVRTKAVTSECDTLQGIITIYTTGRKQEQAFTVNFKKVQEEDEGELKQRKENSAKRNNLAHWLPLVQ